jgi:benzodiazapine receptor
MSDNSSSINKFNWINLLAYALNVVATYGIGVAGGLNLPSNAELSLKYQTLVTPVGWAFAIWGIIFVAQFIWVVAQLGVPSLRNHPIVVEKVRWNYLGVCLMQVGWTFAFSTETIPLSLFFMLGILFFLHRIVSSFKARDVTTSLLQEFPFSIHYGWILSASFVNLNVLLVYVQLSSAVQFVSAVLSLLVLTFMAAASPVMVVTLTVAWACLGIYYEVAKAPAESITQRFSETEIHTIQYLAVGALVVLLLRAVTHLIQQRRQASYTGVSQHSDPLLQE